MKESRREDIARAAQAMVCAIMLDQLDREEAVNFNSFKIDSTETGEVLAIVTVQRPGMMSPIEKYHMTCEALRLIREIAIDDRGDPRADRIIAIADAALTPTPPAAAAAAQPAL